MLFIICIKWPRSDPMCFWIAERGAVLWEGSEVMDIAEKLLMLWMAWLRMGKVYEKILRAWKPLDPFRLSSYRRIYGVRVAHARSCFAFCQALSGFCHGPPHLHTAAAARNAARKFGPQHPFGEAVLRRCSPFTPTVDQSSKRR